ncbi:MAG: flavin-containing monooxygenase [Acidimicrobiales bacterium]
MAGNTTTTTRGDAELFADAVAVANIPTLLMVLVQLTGERRWLDAPYRPKRARGLSDNDTGGLPEDVQAEIRDAALEAILAWREGRPVALPEPSEELLVEMLSCAMGEQVPAEYGSFVADLVGQRLQLPDHTIAAPEGFSVLIVGAGVSGLCTAVNLQAAGIPFTIIEKNDTVGGTWWDNHYPGAGVDTPNHLYSYSFASYDWSMYFCLQNELHSYLEHVADRFDLRRHVQFQTEVEAAEWDDAAQRWDVTIRRPDGSRGTLSAPVVVSAVGIFNPIVLPDIKGLDSFAGQKFHTARWPADADLEGKRVVIIGNGASAMQTGPEIADRVGSLTIFQRSPHWAAPFEHFRKPVPDPIRFLFREVPLYRSWYRLRLGWTFNDRLHTALQKDPNWDHPERSLNATNDAHREYFTRYMEEELGDRADLLPKVVPTYPPYGKRMLMDNGWYRMLRKPNVELVDNPIVEIKPDRVVTEDGREFEADVLILATGFDVLRFMTAFDVKGRSGRSLRDVWNDDDARAYLGMAVPDYPNFFMLYGPNTQPGHGGSLIFVIEMQLHYIMSLLEQMAERGIGAVEVRRDVHDAYNGRVDAAHENMVWTHRGMETYYRNSKGRVVVNFPYRNVDLYRMTRHADLDEYVTDPVKAPQPAGAPAGG